MGLFFFLGVCIDSGEHLSGVGEELVSYTVILTISQRRSLHHAINLTLLYSTLPYTKVFLPNHFKTQNCIIAPLFLVVTINDLYLSSSSKVITAWCMKMCLESNEQICPLSPSPTTYWSGETLKRSSSGKAKEKIIPGDCRWHLRRKEKSNQCENSCLFFPQWEPTNYTRYGIDIVQRVYNKTLPAVLKKSVAAERRMNNCPYSHRIIQCLLDD